MPSTYTVNLGIQKPATGEQSGTWGNTTNANFDILDQGINGAIRLTLTSAGSSGSPNALAINEGSVSDGHNKWIEFYSSSDLGGNVFVQLTPNDAEKIVFVRNSLAGSRSVLLFQGTYNAGRDLEIPAGVDMVVKFSGGGANAATVTDVYTKLRATEITTPSLTATTADINGGTIDNSVIGGSTAAAVTGTAIVANTSLNIAGDGATVTGIKDEDNMASNSATKLATQQSIKTYVDTQVATIPVGDITSVVAGSGLTGGGTTGDVTLNVIGGTGITANANDIAIDATVGTLTGTQTFTNKTLTSAVLNTSVSGTAVLDEDNMASNSATKLATQQSIKSYVDTQVATIPTGDITSVIAGTGLTGGGTSGAVTLNVTTLNQNTTGNAATATALQTARTIAGVSFNGTANISLNNNAITNGAGYTTNTGDITGVTAGTQLTGGGTSGTVTLNLSQGSGSGLDADTCDGLHVGTGRNSTANEIVRTDGSGYAQFGWINTTSGATSTTITRVYMGDNDGYIRYMSPTNFFNQQASALLTAIKTVDGSGSGLDADTLDGVNGASYLRSDTTDYMNANLVFADNARLQIGTNTDLQLFHDGNDSYIREAGTGVLFMDSDDIHFRNGAGSNTLMQLSSDVLTMQGQLQMNGNIINDVEDIYLRDKMYHDGDTNTFFGFGSDTMNFNTGGSTAVTMNNNDLVCYRNLAMSGQIIDNVANIYLGNVIYHHGDTNTFLQFNAADQWQVVTGGASRLRVVNAGVSVTGTLSATGDITAFSDEKLKENIKVIPNAIEKVSQIRGVTYTRNDLEDKEKVYSGVIAQDVEKVLPEVVRTEDDTKTVAYGNMVGLLIEAVKEQQEQINELKKQIEEMK